MKTKTVALLFILMYVFGVFIGATNAFAIVHEAGHYMAAEGESHISGWAHHIAKHPQNRLYYVAGSLAEFGFFTAMIYLFMFFKKWYLFGFPLGHLLSTLILAYLGDDFRILGPKYGYPFEETWEMFTTVTVPWYIILWIAVIIAINIKEKDRRQRLKKEGITV